MKIGFDISPLATTNSAQHQVRGVGSYIRNLQEALSRHTEIEFVFFNKSEGIPTAIDLVHFPYFEPFFLSLPFRKTVPTVITVHDLTPLVLSSSFPSGVKGKLKWEVQKRILSRVDHIITDSSCSKSDIASFTRIDEKKISVVYLAASKKYKQVNDKVILSHISHQYNLPDKFALYVGDVTQNKNLPRLLDAFSTIKIPLVMVGKALLTTKFDRTNPWNKDLVIVQEKVKDLKHVFLLGYVPDEDLQTLYNLATLFIMPSLYEGFGLPILEAMQSGCPVITTKEGSLFEIASDAAYFVDAYDKDDIAKGVNEVFSSAKLQISLRDKGLERAKGFSWEKTANETISIYKKVLHEKKH